MYTESAVQTQCFCITCACLSVCVCVCKNGHLKWLFLFSSIYLKSFGLTCLRHYFIRYGEKKLRIPKQTEAATEKTLKNWHGNSLMLDKWNYLVWVLRSKSASLPVPFRWWWCCCSFGSCCFCYFLWKITTFWRYLSLVFFCLSVSLHICKICFVLWITCKAGHIPYPHTHTFTWNIRKDVGACNFRNLSLVSSLYCRMTPAHTNQESKFCFFTMRCRRRRRIPIITITIMSTTYKQQYGQVVRKISCEMCEILLRMYLLSVFSALHRFG